MNREQVHPWLRMRRSSLRWWLLSRTVATGTRQRALASRFMWGQDDQDPNLYRLRVIGVLGLMVWLEDDDATP
jgi:hypothetical protein